MTDTQRPLADLQTLLADNSSGDISAQDLRDFLLTTALQLDSDGVQAIDYENRRLYYDDGSTCSIDWQAGACYSGTGSGGVYYKNGTWNIGAFVAINVTDRLLRDSYTDYDI